MNAVPATRDWWRHRAQPAFFDANGAPLWLKLGGSAPGRLLHALDE